MTAEKLARWEQHLAFNHRCKRCKIIPRTLRVRPLVENHQGKQAACRASRQFLAVRITKTANTIRHLEHDAFFQRRQLEYALKRDHFDALELLKSRTQDGNQQEKTKEKV